MSSHRHVQALGRTTGGARISQQKDAQTSCICRRHLLGRYKRWLSGSRIGCSLHHSIFLSPWTSRIQRQQFRFQVIQLWSRPFLCWFMLTLRDHVRLWTFALWIVTFAISFFSHQQFLLISDLDIKISLDIVTNGWVIVFLKTCRSYLCHSAQSAQNIKVPIMTHFPLFWFLSQSSWWRYWIR